MALTSVFNFEVGRGWKGVWGVVALCDQAGSLRCDDMGGTCVMTLVA